MPVYRIDTPRAQGLIVTRRGPGGGWTASGPTMQFVHDDQETAFFVVLAVELARSKKWVTIVRTVIKTLLDDIQNS